ncbi:hypothetical protein T310_8908, partial [Rasamsonia emersonii CBS 393.64]
ILIQLRARNPHLPLLNRHPHLIRVFPALIQHPDQRIAKRLAIVPEPLAQRLDVHLHMLLERRVLAQPQHLRRIQLQHVLHDVVVRDLVAPAFLAWVVEQVVAQPVIVSAFRSGIAGMRRVELGVVFAEV